MRFFTIRLTLGKPGGPEAGDYCETVRVITPVNAILQCCQGERRVQFAKSPDHGSGVVHSTEALVAGGQCHLGEGPLVEGRQRPEAPLHRGLKIAAHHLGRTDAVQLT